MATKAHFESHKPSYVLSSRDLILAGQMVRRPDEIPLDSIDFDDLIVDQDHVLKLARDMLGPLGQHSAISARARLVGDQTVHDVLDGAHRACAARILRAETGSNTITATVFHCVGDRVFLQQRALAINSVASLKWPRIGTWCMGVWQQSPWADRGLRLHQVFELAAKKRPRLPQTGLNRAETTALATWGRETASDIQEKPSVLAQIFRTVDYADPDLVRSARTPDPGTDARAIITPHRLKVIVDSFRDREFYAAQRGVMRLILENGLSSRQTEDLVRQASGIVRAEMSEDEVYDIVRGLSINRPRMPRKARGISTSETPLFSNAEVRSLQAELATAKKNLFQAQVQLGYLQDEVDTLRQGAGAMEAASLARFSDQLTQERGRRTQAEDSAARLTAQLTEAERLLAGLINRQVASGRGTNGHTSEIPTNGTFQPWWHDNAYRGERPILDALFNEGIGVDAAAQRFGLTANMVGQFISGALLKQRQQMRRTSPS